MAYETLPDSARPAQNEHSRVKRITAFIGILILILLLLLLFYSCGSHKAPPPTGTAPLNIVLPTISGKALKNPIWEATRGQWQGTRPFSWFNQWLRCDASGANCVVIDKATALVYETTTADVGHVLRFQICAKNDWGSDCATSKPSPVIRVPGHRVKPVKPIKPVEPVKPTKPSSKPHVWPRPTVKIDFHPRRVSHTREASFAFHSNYAKANYRCSIDHHAFKPCQPPQLYLHLSKGVHVFVVKAYARKMVSLPAKFAWVIRYGTDGPNGPPVISLRVVIDSHPAVATSSTDATFTFHTNVSQATLKCSLDEATYTKCLSPFAYYGLATGQHIFRVKAVLSGQKDSSTESYKWKVTPPNPPDRWPSVQIDSYPDSSTTDTSATFTFSSDMSDATFSCSIDSDDYSSCSSPTTYRNLSVGTHRFSVEAHSPKGLTSLTPATYEWQVTVIPSVTPTVTIDSYPDLLTSSTDADFAFHSPNAFGATYQCSIDGGIVGALPITGLTPIVYTDCSSPLAYSNLLPGIHIFVVEAIAGGLTSYPASYIWTIAEAPVTPSVQIDSHPDSSTEETSATFTFSSDTSGASFQCAIDDGDYTSCSPPMIYNDLAVGDHSFFVTASANGLTSDPAEYEWTITAPPVAPTVSIDSGPDNPTIDISATFTFSSDNSDATFECAIDAGDYAPCDSPTTYSGLTVGDHIFSVTASVNGLTSDPATYAWTITELLLAPSVTIDSGPDNPTIDTSATFTFHSDDLFATFECAIDGDFVPCSSPTIYSGLTPGEYTFYVRASAAGLTGATDSYTWTVTAQPTATITSGPDNPTVATSAAFEFSGNSTAASFECSLDDADFTVCTSPTDYSGLSVDDHSFRVRAVDSSDNKGAIDTFTWTITNPPVATITSGPDATTLDTSATFTFTGNDTAVSFECSLDSATFVACTSSINYTDLSVGNHVFQARAIDAQDNVGAIDSYSWTITAPAVATITFTPDNPTDETSATFEFTGNDTAVSFECSLDNADYTACSSPKSYSDLSVGDHTFSVRAIDAQDNIGVSNSYDWTITEPEPASAPTVQIDSHPDDPTADTIATFIFSSPDHPDASFQCAIDGGSWAPCTPPTTYADLATGDHTFSVVAADAGLSSEPATYAWAIGFEPSNTGPPSVTLDLELGGTDGTPQLSGTAWEGDVLSTTDGVWNGTQPITYTYSWLRCDTSGNGCSAIFGATGANYTLTVSNVGNTVRSQVTAHNAAGSASSRTAPSPIVQTTALVNTALPTITGTLIEGHSIHVTNGSWTPQPSSYAYQWFRCDVEGTNCLAISGATSTNYSLQTSDVGFTFYATVTATNPISSVAVSSLAAGPIAYAAPVNTARPTVSGQTVVDHVLTGTNGSWTSSTPLSYSYQWQNSPNGTTWTNISGATNSAYTAQLSDLSLTLRIVVTAHNSGGSASASSVATDYVALAGPENTSLPVISGQMGPEGQTLTSSTGSWDGTPPLDFSYNWERCDSEGLDCTAIAHAGGSYGNGYATHIIGTADVGHRLQVTVTASNAVGPASATSDLTDVITTQAPENTSLPVISGTTTDRGTLSVTNGSWIPSGSASYYTHSVAYQWYICGAAGENCEAVVGATSASIDLSLESVGHRYVAAVTVTNASGQATATSNASSLITYSLPWNTALPTITGQTVVGQTLTVTGGSWGTTTPITSHTYQWHLCNASGSGCVDISGADEATYVLQSADVGHKLRATETVTNSGGSTSARSAATATVSDVISGTPPSLAGDMEVGGTLTGSDGEWSGSPTITYTYAWLRCDAEGANCVAIDDETGSSYVISMDDVGSRIRFQVTATNAYGSVIVTSEPTIVIPTPTVPDAPWLSFVAGDNTYVSGSMVFYLPGSAGSFVVTATAFDPSHVSAYNFPSLGTGWIGVQDDNQETYSFGEDSPNPPGPDAVTITSTAGQTSDASLFVVEADSTAPTTSILCNGVACASSYSDAVTVTLNATDGGSGTSRIAYSLAGNADPLTNGTTYTGSFAVSATTTVSFAARDRLGNIETTRYQTITLIPPVNTALPVISGTAQEGQTLTTSNGSWNSSPTSYSYQWRLCDGVGANCGNVTGATSSSYTVQATDIGGTLRAVVTAHNAGGSTEATSNQTDVVADPTPVNTALPVISGDLIVGQDVSASTGEWDSPMPIDYYAYQWQRCDAAGDNCEDISSWGTGHGPTESSYTVQNDDIGHTLRVRVQAGYSGSPFAGVATSNQTDVVADPTPVNTALPVISGTAQVGEELSVSNGEWTSPLPIDYYAYQWQLCDGAGVNCGDITGATSSSYTVQVSDVGHTLRVRVDVGYFGLPFGAFATSNQTDVVPSPEPENLLPPQITGEALEGQTLTADTGTWDSEDLTFSYQWRLCDVDGDNCADISDATSSSYTPQAGDISGTLRVVVTATNIYGSTPATSDQTSVIVAALPENTSLPEITGTAQEGETLSASTGSWLFNPTSYSYQWQLCDEVGTNCTDISGATSATYESHTADIGSTIRVQVTATNTAGSVTATSVQTDVVVAAPMGNVTLPEITGTAEEGSTLSVSNGTWIFEPNSYNYQWQRCDVSGENCADIDDATSSSYTVQVADIGDTLRAVVWALNGGNSAAALSEATSVIVGRAPVNTALPEITGTATVGQVLQTTNGSWGGTAPFDYTYRWRLCDADGANCVDITGAISSSYTVQESDIGHTLRIRVAATNIVDSSSVTSTQTDVVSAGVTPPVNTSLPVISGTAQEGQTLTTTNGSWDNTPDSYSYQWQLCDAAGENCGDITGAISSSYEVQTGDIGITLRSVVTATNDGGSTAATSDHTSPIVAAPSITISNADYTQATFNQITEVSADTSLSASDTGIFIKLGSVATQYPCTVNGAGRITCPISPSRSSQINVLYVGADHYHTSSLAISSMQASNFSYTLGSDPTKVAAISFTTTDTDARAVRIQPISSSSYIYTCTNSSGSVTCDTSTPTITVLGIASSGIAWWSSNYPVAASTSVSGLGNGAHTIIVSDLTPANCTGANVGSSIFYAIVNNTGSVLKADSGHTTDTNQIWLGNNTSTIISASTGNDCILPGGVPSGAKSITGGTGTDYSYGGPGPGTYTFSVDNTTRPIIPYVSVTNTGVSYIGSYISSSVVYTFNNFLPTNLDSWEFDLSASASVVYSKLVSGSSTYTACVNGSGTHWTCTSSVAVSSVDQLRIIAAR